VIDGNNFIPVTAYMFLPSEAADSETAGYRWKTGETINIRLTVSGDDNKETQVILADAVTSLT